MAKKSNSPSTGGASGTVPPPSAASLRAQAERETNLDIGNEVAPLNTEIGDAQQNMQNALKGIGGMFDNLLPYVQGSAQRVGNFYQQGLAEEKGVWAEANARLAQLRGQRAAEAQGMAQQIGGPVPLSAFLAPLNTSLAEMPHAQAGGLLRSNALAQGGVQEAEAFAGRVFPLLRTEQEAAVRNQFQQRITDLQKEIDRIKATSSTRTRTRLDQLTQQEREYKLEQARDQLARLTADRDWRIARQNAADNRARIANDRANLLGYYDKPWRDKQGHMHTSRIYTLGGRQLTEQERATRAGEAATRAAQAETKRSNQQNEAIDQQTIEDRKIEASKAAAQNAIEIRTTREEAAAKYIDAVMTPGTQSVTYTRYDPVPANEVAGMNKASLIPDGKGGWVKATKVTVPVATPVIQNPFEIYKFLVAHAIPPAIARKMVRLRFGFGPGWVPGGGPQGPGAPAATDRGR